MKIEQVPRGFLSSRVCLHHSISFRVGFILYLLTCSKILFMRPFVTELDTATFVQFEDNNSCNFNQYLFHYKNLLIEKGEVD